MNLRDRATLELRRGYHRARLAPLARAAATGELFRPKNPDASHLASYAEDATAGALQRDEAFLLFGAVRALRPKTVVEIGFLRGRSAFNFLRAMDADAALYSFDIDENSQRLAGQLFAHDRRFRFILKSQDEIGATDIDGRQIDLVFIDASHDLELNQRTYRALEGLLAPRAVVAIHDTGTWARKHLDASAAAFAAQNPDGWLSDELFAHRPDEREFVDWITETRPDVAAIHFHTESTIRQGLTLLQAGGPLATDGGPVDLSR